jgi:hypothetical protein
MVVSDILQAITPTYIQLHFQTVKMQSYDPSNAIASSAGIYGRVRAHKQNKRHTTGSSIPGTDIHLTAHDRAMVLMSKNLEEVIGGLVELSDKLGVYDISRSENGLEMDCSTAIVRPVADALQDVVEKVSFTFVPLVDMIRHDPSIKDSDTHSLFKLPLGGDSAQAEETLRDWAKKALPGGLVKSVEVTHIFNVGELTEEPMAMSGILTDAPKTDSRSGTGCTDEAPFWWEGP